MAPTAPTAPTGPVRSEALYAFVLAALALVGVIVLAALGDKVPDVLSGVALGAAFGGVGAIVPARAAGG